LASALPPLCRPENLIPPKAEVSDLREVEVEEDGVNPDLPRPRSGRRLSRRILRNGALGLCGLPDEKRRLRFLIGEPVRLQDLFERIEVVHSRNGDPDRRRPVLRIHDNFSQLALKNRIGDFEELIEGRGFPERHQEIGRDVGARLPPVGPLLCRGWKRNASDQECDEKTGCDGSEKSRGAGHEL
jgi:hypothetical protein